MARLGEDIYDGTVRSQVEPSNKGQIVAIDIETGTWEIDSKEIIACSPTKYPTAQRGLLGVGSLYVRRFGVQVVSKQNDCRSGL